MSWRGVVEGQFFKFLNSVSLPFWKCLWMRSPFRKGPKCACYSQLVWILLLRPWLLRLCCLILGHVLPRCVLLWQSCGSYNTIWPVPLSNWVMHSWPSGTFLKVREIHSNSHCGQKRQLIYLRPQKSFSMLPDYLTKPLTL